MPYKDPEQKKKHRKAYYERTKAQAHEYYLENKLKFRDRNRVARRRNTEFVNEYKVKHGCSKCGYKTHACGIDFHHTEKKKENVARMAKSCLSIESLLVEMSKCILLCATCHREEHYAHKS